MINEQLLPKCMEEHKWHRMSWYIAEVPLTDTKHRSAIVAALGFEYAFSRYSPSKTTPNEPSPIFLPTL